VFFQKPEKEVAVRIRAHFFGLAVTGEVTLGLLFLCSLLITSYDQLGTSMKCFTNEEKQQPGIDARMDSICLNAGTFIIDVESAQKNLFSDGNLTLENVKKMYSYKYNHRNRLALPGSEYEARIEGTPAAPHLVIPVIHPGIPLTFKGEEKYRINFIRYKWGSTLLVLQGLCFAIPLYLWKTVEKGTIARLIQDLHHGGAITQERRKEEIKFCALQILKLKSGNNYVLSYYILDIINIFQIPIQFYLTHLFLHRKFFNYGPKTFMYLYRQWLGSSNEGEVSPIDTIFPSNVKCEFSSYGPTGSKSTDSAHCILSMHDVMSKVMFFLWFWYALLFCMCVLAFIINVFDDLKRLLRTEGYRSMIRGQMFLLRLLRINMDDITFSELVKAVEVNDKYCESKKVGKESSNDCNDQSNGSEDPKPKKQVTDHTVIEMGPMGDICGNNLVRVRQK